MKIYLVRHGQTTGDVEDKSGRDKDARLTGFGQRQAKNLVKELVGEKIEIIFTTPKIRARETARILQEELKVKVEIINDFSVEQLLSSRKKTVMIIAHDELLKPVYRDLLKMGDIKLEDCSYSILEADKKGLKLISNKGITQV